MFTFVLCKHLGMELLDQRGETWLTSLETARLSPEVIRSLCVPAGNAWEIHLLHILATIWWCQSITFELFWWYLAVALIHIFLTTNDAELFSMCFLTIYLSFVKYSRFFCPIFFIDFDFLLLSWRSLSFWIQILCRCIFSEYFLPACGLPVFFKCLLMRSYIFDEA